MDEFVFTLYVSGHAPRSQQAIANLQRICTELIRADCRLAVVDVVEDPGRAESDRILTTPTLVKEAPPPFRRLTGDLSDAARVLTALELLPHERSDTGDGE